MLYLAVGLVRYDTAGSGNYDLGIFSQAAQRWSEARWPGSAIRGLDNLFGDHFSPVTVLFGAAWWLQPDPRALIAAQALALAAAVFVVALAAFRHLPTLVAVPVVTGVVLAKGVVSAAVFDVHETGLGAPLAAGLGVGLLERRRSLVIGCALGLLLVKEDLGFTVLVAGALWWYLTGQRRAGLLLAAAGVVGLVVAFGVVLVVNPEHSTPYLQFLTGASGNAQGLPGIGPGDGHRWEPALLFAVTTGLVGLRSPIALLALPTLAWRFVSSNESYWQTYFHYDVLLVPIAAIALVDVLSRPAERRAAAVRVGVGVVALGIAAGLGVVRLGYWPLLDPAGYRLSPRLQAAEEVARRIPAGSAVAVQQDLGPLFVADHDVRMLSTLPAGPVRWVVLTADGSSLGASARAKRAWLAAEAGGAEITTTDGVVVVRLPAPRVVRLPSGVGGPRP